MPLTAGLASWPGDTPFVSRRTLEIARGGSVNLSEIQTSVHNGTHADAPYHFDGRGPAIDAVALEHYVGRATVVDARGPSIEADALAPAVSRGATRVLLRTLAWRDRSVFPDTVPVLSGAAVDLLASAGALLLGVDVPSVDEIESKTLWRHHALHRAGTVILENLLLDDVEPGDYELIALPLRLAGLDASPVRAVLRTL